LNKAYEYRHLVTLEETNAVGNVYFVNHIAWQGRCREQFLHEHVPEILSRIGRDLCIVTMSCSCNYIAEVQPFDVVIVRMRLAQVRQNRMTLSFEYFRDEELIATGQQEIAFMLREGESLTPIPIPAKLAAVTSEYAIRTPVA
jgi:enediyne biosynthesis thioesterase